MHDNVRAKYLPLGLICLMGSFFIGCGEAVSTPPAGAAPLELAAADPQAANDAAADTAALPEDLRTRKTGSDWPAFLGPTADSKSTEKGILSPWPKAGPRVVWSKRVGIGYGMPSVSRGRLFHFDRVGDKATLTCMKSESGEALWKFDYATDYQDMYGYNNGPRCCPVVDEDRVYIYGAEGMLHCLRVANGELVWKADTVATFGVVQNFFGVGSVPVVEGELLIVHVGGSPPGSGFAPSFDQKTNGTGIVAFDKRTGKVKYKIGDELASYATPVLSTINGRRWCFMFARGGLLGFEPASGKIDFHYPWRARIIESVNAANPVVVGDQVFISETYGPGSSLLKIKPAGYDVVWSDADKGREKSMQTHWNTPLYHQGYLYASSGRHKGNAELRCIEFATGKILWSKPELTRSSLLMVDGHFVCLAEDGQLYLLRVNPEKFDLVSHAFPQTEAGTALLPEPSWAAPILSHGLMYVRGDGTLACLELIPEKK